MLRKSLPDRFESSILAPPFSLAMSQRTEIGNVRTLALIGILCCLSARGFGQSNNVTPGLDFSIVNVGPEVPPPPPGDGEVLGELPHALAARTAANPRPLIPNLFIRTPACTWPNSS